MPTYDYRCPANGQVVEVRHGMAEEVATWGELCERTGIEPGGTPPESPVERLISAAGVVSSGSLRNPEPPACGSGGCGGGMCGL